MALEKSKDWKGSTANYWKIITAISDFQTNTTRVVLGLYLNKEARDLGISNFVERQVIDVVGVDLTREDEYAKIKESKLDDQGVETNWFADAIDA